MLLALQLKINNTTKKVFGYSNKYEVVPTHYIIVIFFHTHKVIKQYCIKLIIYKWWNK